MDELEMECNDFESAASRKAEFKTPLPVKCKSSLKTTMESGYLSSCSINVDSTVESWTCGSQRSEQESCRHSLFPQDSCDDSVFSSPASTSKRSHILLSLETPDSGIGSDSVFTDDEPSHQTPLKCPVVPESLSSCLGAKNRSRSLALWQSTPLNGEGSNTWRSLSERDFEGGLSNYLGDCFEKNPTKCLEEEFEKSPTKCLVEEFEKSPTKRLERFVKSPIKRSEEGFEKSPTKRRRVALRKPSRDIFAVNNPSTSTLSGLPSAGCETVDFLFFLGKQSFFKPALESILRNLQPVDLCRAASVSRTWKTVIDSVPSATQRKKLYINNCMQIKENLYQSAKKLDSAYPFRGQLVDIQNFNITEESPRPSPRSPPVSPSKVRFNLYVKEGRKLGDGQTLVQCPMCTLPSRKETAKSARCTRQGCQFYFCVLCLCKFHGDKSCPVSTVRHRKRITSIGSRESRRNLQRL